MKWFLSVLFVFLALPGPGTFALLTSTTTRNSVPS
jgi:threonine/homoserine/homoserine lactone efflux protein